MDHRDTLLHYPYVVVRLKCDVCNRRGGFRLARLVEKFGCDIPLEDLVKRLAHPACGHRPENQRKGKRWTIEGGCKAYLRDLESPMPPPDMPGAPALRPDGRPRLRVVASNGRSKNLSKRKKAVS